MIDNVPDLRVFTRIAATGSLSSAARDLGLSLSMVSKRLARLEAAFQVRLVNRSSRTITLTESGIELLPRALSILRQVEETEVAMTAERSSVGGTLRITATAAFARRRLAPCLPRFMAQYPQLRIHLIATDRKLDIIAERIDVAIRRSDLTDSSMVTRTLAPDRRVLVASPSYVSVHGAPQRPEDLKRHRCAVVGDPPITIWRLSRGANTIAVEIDWTLLVDDGETAHAVALAGGAITLKPLWDVAEDLAAKRLVRVLPDWEPPAVSIQAVFASRHHQPARIRTFVTFLEKGLREEASRLGL